MEKGRIISELIWFLNRKKDFQFYLDELSLAYLQAAEKKYFKIESGKVFSGEDI